MQTIVRGIFALICGAVAKRLERLRFFELLVGYCVFGLFIGFFIVARSMARQNVSTNASGFHRTMKIDILPFLGGFLGQKLVDLLELRSYISVLGLYRVCVVVIFINHFFSVITARQLQCLE